MHLGTSLGPYTLTRELGVGGMGKVYAATDESGATVALKIVHPHLLESNDAAERFRREIEIGTTIDHPNVVRTLTGGVADGHHFLAMEYVAGQTLDGLLQELTRVPEELCRHIGREVCKGLSAIHAAGAIHRDLKPENVLITPDHDVKIMDLGVARSTDDALRLSQTGAFVGSLHYACPEQFTGGGKGLDGRVDLHALGLVCYELATGVCPFLADDVPQTVRKVLHEEPRRLGEIDPQLSAFFEEVVHTLLAKDRDARFADADALLEVLERGEESDWWRERTRTLHEETRRPVRRIRIPRETAVFGRDAQLATLRGLYDAAKAGSGQVVLIEGEAGIGKSRLVDEFVARLRAEGEEIHFLFGSYPPGGAATVDGGFSEAYREHLGPAGSAAWLPDNPALVPAFDALLRGEGPPAGTAPLETSSLQTCFARVTQSLAAQFPTVVLIDDLHFAPAEGRGLFASLAMSVPAHPVLLVGTARPGVPEEWRAGLTRLPQTHAIDVPRLGSDDLARLLADSLGSAHLAESLAAKVAEKSDGNPFFTFEVVRGLREGQFLTQREDGTWTTTRLIDEIQVPSSVLDLVAARVSALTDDERELLEVAACCGHEFEPGVVAAACGLGVIPVLKQLGRIERSHRLVRSRGRRYAFDHHQVHEALYGSLHEMLREQYHVAIAEHLETSTGAAGRDVADLAGALCVDLCRHFLAGRSAARAQRYARRAHAHLEQQHLGREAASILQQILEAPGLLDDHERAACLMALGWTQTDGGDWDGGEATARAMLALAERSDDALLECEALRLLGSLALRRARFEETLDHGRRALTIAESLEDQALHLGSLTLVGDALNRLGRVEEARALFEDLANRAVVARNAEAEVNALLGIGRGYVPEGKLQEAVAIFERAADRSRQEGLEQSEAIALINLPDALLELNRLDEALDCARRVTALARRQGRRLREVAAMGQIGAALQAQGRLREAIEVFESTMPVARELDAPILLARTLGKSAIVGLSLCRMDLVRVFAEENLAISRSIGDAGGACLALWYLSEPLRQEGDFEGCAARLREALAIVRECRYDSYEVGMLVGLGTALRDMGRVDEARAELELAVETSKRVASLGSDVSARCALAQLTGEGVEEAVEYTSQREQDLPDSVRIGAYFALWKAGGDREHLEIAKRALDGRLALVAAEDQHTMKTGSRLHRELLEAWEAEFGDEAGSAPRPAPLLPQPGSPRVFGDRCGKVRAQCVPCPPPDSPPWMPSP